MTKLLLALTLIVPSMTFAQDPVYKLTGGGMFFMIFAWTAIFTWNAVCFTRILADDNKKED